VWIQAGHSPRHCRRHFVNYQRLDHRPGGIHPPVSAPSFTGLNFIVTIHKMRCPGMTWFRMPLFVWPHYAASILMVLGTPVVAIAIVLVALGATIGIGVSIPQRRRIRSCSSIFLVLLAPCRLHYDSPRMGVISETFRRSAASGSSAIRRSHFSIGGHCGVRVLRLGAPHVHHGHFKLRVLVFSLLTMLVACLRHQDFQLDFTLYKGSITFETPCSTPSVSWDCLPSAA